MENRENWRILRSHWVLILVTTLIGAILGAALTLLLPSMYSATSRLFVSTTSSNIIEAYQGSLASQQRVRSYASLASGTGVAQRAIDDLGLDMTPAELVRNLTAEIPTETVLLDISVRDPDASRAADLANAVARQLTDLVAELETPENGGPAASRLLLVEPATPPFLPAGLNIYLIVVVGGALGLVIGLSLSVMRERSDTTIKDGATLEHASEATWIGTIPVSKRLAKEPELNFSRDQSEVAEAFRELRTNLHFLQVDSPPRVVVVTSAITGEGKTTTAVNLALVLAESGSSVLLIEGNLRVPGVARILELTQDVGLSTVVTGQANVDTAIQQTSHNRLSFLGSGPLPPNPAALLGSMQARTTIKSLKSRFDYIIIDSPPLLPTIDAAELTMIADGAIVVVEHGRTTKDQLGRTVRKLSSIGANVLGVVFTKVPTSSANPGADALSTRSRQGKASVHSRDLATSTLRPNPGTDPTRPGMPGQHRLP